MEDVALLRGDRVDLRPRGAEQGQQMGVDATHIPLAGHDVGRQGDIVRRFLRPRQGRREGGAGQVGRLRRVLRRDEEAVALRQRALQVVGDREDDRTAGWATDAALKQGFVGAIGDIAQLLARPAFRPPPLRCTPPAWGPRLGGFSASARQQLLDHDGDVAALGRRAVKQARHDQAS
jgi:hypothetical protein